MVREKFRIKNTTFQKSYPVTSVIQYCIRAYNMLKYYIQRNCNITIVSSFVEHTERF